jgi:hypothetical protein
MFLGFREENIANSQNKDPKIILHFRTSLSDVYETGNFPLRQY